MPRPTAGNPAQRSLVAAINHHPLTTQRVEAGEAPVTAAQVRRLGQDRLAPRLRDGDQVDVALVEHCAAMLAGRRPGRGLPDDLLPLKLAVDGYPMLSEYVKSGAVRHLGGLVETMSKVAAEIGEVNEYETPIEDVIKFRGVDDNDKPPELARRIMRDFRIRGIDSRYTDSADGSSWPTRDGSRAVMINTVTSIISGGPNDDPALAAESFQAMTGQAVDPRAYKLDAPPLSRIVEWLNGREWDDRVTLLMRLNRASLSAIPGFPHQSSGTSELIGNLVTSTTLVKMGDRTLSVKSITDMLGLITGESGRLLT